MIRHIVMWKFREGEEENREKFLSGLQALDGVIPAIRHMEIHRSCKPGNPYDACLIADFDDLDALSRALQGLSRDLRRGETDGGKEDVQ